MNERVRDGKTVVVGCYFREAAKSKSRSVCGRVLYGVIERNGNGAGARGEKGG